jgi:SSS family solute:Na+ symporter
MRPLDWSILILALSATILYGLYKSRTQKNLDGYFLGDREMPWYLVLLSIVGTQASAITFLSAPGQAYTDGMRFVQYYFGLPLAMVVLSVTFVPMFRRLNVYTAYEYLEQRFDRKTRTFTSVLFLLSRGLSTGISVYAPSIILSSLLGWNIYSTNVIMGGLLIIYTVSGGAKAVAHTQKLQMIIMVTGLFLAGWMIVHMLPQGVGFADALHISGRMGRLNVITTGISEKGFDWKDRYNIFSGLIGGFFFALSYFGTDQSQVGRYLTARSLSESRIGLLLNGMVKVPMQFGILLLGALVFTFYQFNNSPLFYNNVPLEKVRNSASRDSLLQFEKAHETLEATKKSSVARFVDARKVGDAAGEDAAIAQMQSLQKQEDGMRAGVKKLIVSQASAAESNDTNYIFLHFVLDHLPAGLVGLLIAVIFLASWGSIAAALNSLASTSVVDLHIPFVKKERSELDEYKLSRLYTLGWGIFCIIVAQFVTGMGSLIEAVNVLGSWFYGVILGVFLVAFYMKRVGGSAVFWAAIAGEAIVLGLYFMDIMGWLWLTMIGAMAVVLLASIFQSTIFRARTGA